jgi:mRNA interferase MazF
MQKDFDTWNNKKKLIHSESANPPYLERDIWWCSIGINIGYEEDGDGNDSERPAVIIRGFSKELCWVVPLTTSKKKNRYYLSVGIVDEKEAQAMITQMKPLDTKRFINRIGLMDWDNFDKLEKAIRDILQ